MNPIELLKWQKNGYARYHGDRRNLLIHSVAVPLFLAGNCALAIGLAYLSWGLALAGLVASIVSLKLQGWGHARERIPAEPFSGLAQAVARLLLEQWITFPHFVLSGGWRSALGRK